MPPEPKLYFAAPLFSQAEKDFNLHVARQLSNQFDVFLPQRDGKLLVDLVKDGMDPDKASKLISKMDLKEVKKAKYFLAVLDGRTVDEGVAFELGYAHRAGKYCIGLKTDVRTLLTSGDNPMIKNALKMTFYSIEDLLDWAEDR